MQTGELHLQFKWKFLQNLIPTRHVFGSSPAFFPVYPCSPRFILYLLHLCCYHPFLADGKLTLEKLSDFIKSLSSKVKGWKLAKITPQTHTHPCCPLQHSGCSFCTGHVAFFCGCGSQRALAHFCVVLLSSLYCESCQVLGFQND